MIVPKLSSDAYALQIIINLIQPVEIAWSLAADWLRGELHIIFNNLPEAVLGHSIVYRANIEMEMDTETPVLEPSLLRTLPTIFSKFPIESPQLYRQQHFPGQGWLSLLALPQAPGGGLVYLALGRADQNVDGDLAHIAYATYHGLLVSVDLFYHKGVKQGMELVSVYPDYVRNKVEPLKRAIHNLLRQDSGSRLASERDLEQVSIKVAQQTDFYWQIDHLKLSLSQQISGTERLFTHSELPPIALHHLAILRAYQDEAQAYVRKNKTVLDTARTALALVEARESKHSGKTQERFNYIVAFVGIFLAADQILDNEFAKELLIGLGLFCSATQMPYWTTFFTRLSAAVALAAVLFGVFELLKCFWRKR